MVRAVDECGLYFQDDVGPENGSSSRQARLTR